MGHREVPIKVNAWVDEGIAPLVAALNEFEGLQTVESCQGAHGRLAYVYFKYRGRSMDALVFVDALANALSKGSRSQYDHTVRIEWTDDNPEPMAQILVAPQFVDQIASALSSIAKAFRRSGSADGR
jgi:hypothetical protein